MAYENNYFRKIVNINNKSFEVTYRELDGQEKPIALLTIRVNNKYPLAKVYMVLIKPLSRETLENMTPEYVERIIDQVKNKDDPKSKSRLIWCMGCLVIIIVASVAMFLGYIPFQIAKCISYTAFYSIIIAGITEGVSRLKEILD